MQEALMYLYDQCNYDCHYCMLGNPNHKSRVNAFSETEEGIEKIVEFFDSHGKWNVFLSGGEPTEHPLFIELVSKLTLNHTVRIDTNNSMCDEKLERFVNEIDCKKIEYVHCSLHEVDEDEERLSDYIERLVYLQKHDFNVFTTFVATSERIEKLERIDQRFKAAGIPFVVVPLRTPDYPAAYTKEEVNILDKYMISSVHRAYLDIDYRPVKGRLCHAEHSRVNIDAISGKVHRCWRKRNSIGDIYDNTLSLANEAITCEEEQCTYYFEPNQEVEELVKQDIKNILACRGHYDQYLRSDFQDFFK